MGLLIYIGTIYRKLSDWGVLWSLSIGVGSQHWLRVLLVCDLLNLLSLWMGLLSLVDTLEGFELALCEAIVGHLTHETLGAAQTAASSTLVVVDRLCHVVTSGQNVALSKSVVVAVQRKVLQRSMDIICNNVGLYKTPTESCGRWEVIHLTKSPNVVMVASLQSSIVDVEKEVAFLILLNFVQQWLNQHQRDSGGAGMEEQRRDDQS